MSLPPLGAWPLLASAHPREAAIRPATPADLPAIEALMAPHLESGALLPRHLRAEELLVAALPEGTLVGCVGLAPWTERVVELGSLVSAQPGLGRRLVAAALGEAAARGHQSVVALSGLPGFFLRCGFQAEAIAPWALARGLHPGRRATADLRAKAGRCAACPRLAGCQQTLFRFDLAALAAPPRRAAPVGVALEAR